jgi:hypothetical protein
MPSFVDALNEEQRWDFANYVYSLSPATCRTTRRCWCQEGARDLDIADAKLFDGPTPRTSR